MRKILELLLGLPLAISLLLAFAGAMLALFGGTFGIENARVVGGTICGFGALAFFALLLSPYMEILVALGSFKAGSTAQSNVNAQAEAPNTAPGKKDRENDRVA
jgi:hypothetical protein